VARERVPFQFTIRTLLAVTAGVAVLFSMGQSLGLDVTAHLVFWPTVLVVGGFAVALLDREVVIGAIVGAVGGVIVPLLLTTVRFYASVPNGMMHGLLIGALIGDIVAESRCSAVADRNGASGWTCRRQDVAPRWGALAARSAVVLVVVEIVLVVVGMLWLPSNGAWQRIRAFCVHEEFTNSIFDSAYAPRYVVLLIAGTWSLHVLLGVSLLAAGLVRRGQADDACYRRRLSRVGFIHSLAMLLLASEVVAWLECSLSCSSGHYPPSERIWALVNISACLPSLALLALCTLLFLGKHLPAYWRQCGWLLVPAAVAMVNAIVAMIAITLLLLV